MHVCCQLVVLQATTVTVNDYNCALTEVLYTQYTLWNDLP